MLLHACAYMKSRLKRITLLNGKPSKSTLRRIMTTYPTSKTVQFFCPNKIIEEMQEIMKPLLTDFKRDIQEFYGLLENSKTNQLLLNRAR